MWDTVSIHYTANFSNGDFFDATPENIPLTFVAGNNEILPWLDAALLWKKYNKQMTISLDPKAWYGWLYNPNLVQKINSMIFDTLNVVPKTGEVQKLDNLIWIIRWLDTDENGNSVVLFDINPRETWDTLNYKVTILPKQQL